MPGVSEIRRLAARVGLEQPLLRAYEWRSAAARRDRRDNQCLSRLLAFSLAEDSDCIDVGCHRGEVLEQMIRLAPRGRHVAFEPVPGSHAGLATAFPGVDVRHAAVSDTDGEAEFVVVCDEPSYTGCWWARRACEFSTPTDRARTRKPTSDAVFSKPMWNFVAHA